MEDISHIGFLAIVAIFIERFQLYCGLSCTSVFLFINLCGLYSMYKPHIKCT
jgi:hypothetical protein